MCMYLRYTRIIYETFPLRFRSQLSNKFGIQTKQRTVVYSGRGRPPKGLLTGMADGGKDSSDEEDDPLTVVPGGVASEGVEPAAGEGAKKDYSEEDTDEEVRERGRESRDSGEEGRGGGGEGREGE